MSDTPPTDTPSTDPLGAALEAVTGNMARRFSVRVDRLLAQVADLTELERQIEELAQLEAQLKALESDQDA